MIRPDVPARDPGLLASASHRARRDKIARRLATWTLPWLLCGCFTMGLWGFEPVDEVSPVTGDVDSHYRYDEETSWSWGLFALRVLLTPVTAVLDCVTYPAQKLLFDDDDPPQQRRRGGC